MKLSNRLLSCAEMVQRGNIAADVGADHGYLSIYLLENGICPYVYVSDLREMPLNTARKNALRAGQAGRITFCLSDGLQAVPLSEIQTIICAGMGGETIAAILEAVPCLNDPQFQLILQPQTCAGELRRRLAENGFSIQREKLSQDGAFLYTAMEVRFGGVKPLSPGRQLMPQYLMESGDPLLRPYFQQVKKRTEQTLLGLRRARNVDQVRRDFYETAMRELREMEKIYGIRE